MKALSLYQPWAALMVDGFKTIENRTREHGFRTPFPQRIALHASKTYDGAAPLRIMRLAQLIENEPLIRRVALSGYSEQFVDKGAIIGVCDFIDAGNPNTIRRKYPEDAVWVFEEASWCYVVRNARRLARPIPYRGMQGFFEVPDDLLAGLVA